MPQVRAIQIQPGQIVFRVHGPRDDERVRASVFAQKLGALVQALKAADRAVHHGKTVHEYEIAKLQSSEPTAILSEVHIPKFAGQLDVKQSGIDAFGDCATAVIAGDRERAQRYGKCPGYLAKLGQGASKKFGYAEVWTSPENIIRVDPFLLERATTVLGIEKKGALTVPEGQRWFRGAAHGSFDGTILAVDLRGARPELKLILSAGEKQIDCIARDDHIEEIRAALKRRVRVFGKAIYDGRSGLPRRIEIADIKQIRTEVDFSRWKGSFTPSQLNSIDDDDL